MDNIEKLEGLVDSLLSRVRSLEEENRSIREQLESELRAKEEVSTRVDGLLKKIQDELI